MGCADVLQSGGLAAVNQDGILTFAEYLAGV